MRQYSSNFVSASLSEADRLEPRRVLHRKRKRPARQISDGLYDQGEDPLMAHYHASQMDDQEQEQEGGGGGGGGGEMEDDEYDE